MSKNVRLAFFGTGNIARHHLNNLKAISGNEIVGLCDAMPEAAKKAAAEFGGTAYGSLDEMFDGAKPDAVVICTPPFARLEPIQAACERNVPFFCEKPPAFALEDALKIRDIVEKAGTLHSIGFMYRHMQIADAAKAHLAGQTVIAVRSTFMNGPLLNPNFPAWFKLQEKSGGPVLDQSIHIFDLLRYLVGDVETVFGLGSNRATTRGPEVTIHDTFNVVLRFKSGVDGTHNHSWASEPPLIVVELLLKDGVLRMDLKGNKLTGIVAGEAVELDPKDEFYKTEFVRFLEAVRTGDAAPIRSTYDDAVGTLAVCRAVIDSAEAGAPMAVFL